MNAKLSTIQRLMGMARSAGVIRRRDVVAHGIHPEYLRRLCARGLLVRTGWGLYASADADVTSQHTLAQACVRVPHGVICLLSALRFHEIGTQNPHEVWMALDRKSHLPKIAYPPLHIVRFSGNAWASGIEHYSIEGISVQVYGPAKTLVDCFKYRNKIGLEVVLEALRDCWGQGRTTMDELWNYAKICRMTNVMRPYLESLT